MEQSTRDVEDLEGERWATLPFELVSLILELSAQSFSTQHARNVCLVSRAVYAQCWPSLHRIIALRSAKQLRDFSESIHQPGALRRRDRDRLVRRQDAIKSLYLNNNRDPTAIVELPKDEKPEMWMLSIILAARNLEVLHVEEFWSISYPWELQEERPLLAYPLLLLTTHLAALHASLVTSSDSQWGPRTSSLRKVKLGDSDGREGWTWQVPQPREVTLSALAMLPSHLLPPIQHPSMGAFSRLSRLHFYYAKVDEHFVNILMQMPQLTHLRLTRPFSEHLADAVFRLLGDGEEVSEIERLVVEAGIYMDDRTTDRLTELQHSPHGQGRFYFIDNLLQQRMSRTEDNQHLDMASSTSQIVNWVTSSEERGFDQFKRRVEGGEGVWAG